MTSHFFTPENQSFDETEVPSSPEPKRAEHPKDNVPPIPGLGKLHWCDLCDKDKPWGQKMVAKLIEERIVHEKTEAQLAIVKREVDNLKFYHRDTKDDKMIMMGVLGDHKVLKEENDGNDDGGEK